MLPMVAESPGSLTASVHAGVFSTHCARSSIIATAVMGTRLHQHGPVLYFRSPQGGTDAGEGDQFRFASSDYFQSLLASQHALSTGHSWSLELVNSSDFFTFFCGHHLSALDVGQLSRWLGVRKKVKFTLLKYTGVSKSRFTVFCMENSTIINNYLHNCFVYSQLYTYFCPHLYNSLVVSIFPQLCNHTSKF